MDSARRKTARCCISLQCVCTQCLATASLSRGCGLTLLRTTGGAPRWRSTAKKAPPAMKPLVIYGAEGSGNSQKASPVR
jgi:hypothetical protein